MHYDLTEVEGASRSEEGPLSFNCLLDARGTLTQNSRCLWDYSRVAHNETAAVKRSVAITREGEAHDTDGTF